MKSNCLSRVFHIGLSAMLLLLSGCTSLKLPPTGKTDFYKETWEQRQHSLQHIQNWNISGAFSITDQDKSVIASYTWRQHRDAYNIYIHSSLNLYTADIIGSSGSVLLRRANGQQFSAKTPEQLMQKQLGWQLPISKLLYWVRGLPAPGRYQATLDRYSHLIYLEQAGWQVRFSNYVPISYMDLPRTLQLNNLALRIKIVVKRWGL